MVTFGKTAAEEAAERIARSGTFFIKTFRDDQTKVRFLEETTQFIVYGEHFDRARSITIPCAVRAGAAECLGCANPDPEVSKESSKWAFHVLDDRDYVQVYKVGVKFFKVLEGVAKSLGHGTLCDRDYTVLRMGSGLDTSYMATPAGEPYERHPSISLPDISGLLADKYGEAMDAYGYEPGEPGTGDNPDEPTPGPTPDDEPITPIDGGAVEAAGDSPDFNLMTSAQLKNWLTSRPNPVRIGDRVTRAELLKLAEGYIPF